MGMFTLGAVVSFFLFLIIFVFSEEQKSNRNIKNIRKELQDVTLDNINLYDIKSYASVKSITGDGTTTVDDLDMSKSYEEDGFLYIDGVEFNKDKIISIDHYDIGKAKLHVNNETIYFDKVEYYDDCSVDMLYTSHFMKKYNENIAIEVNKDNSLTVFLHSKHY